MKNLPYAFFRERIQQKAKDKHFPLRVLFELTYKCNFNCSYCYLPPKARIQNPESRIKQELSTQQIFSILDELKKMGCFYLGFTGGEIFLREDIFDILWYAKKSGFSLIILTNASLIDRPKVEELKKIGLSKVDITLHSMNRVSFENITRIKDSYKKVSKAIKLLYKRGIPLGFKNCALKENEDDIEKVREFAHKLGALARLGAGVTPRLDGSCEPLKYGIGALVPKAIDLKPLYENKKKIFLRESKRKQKRKKRRVFDCAAGTQTLTINPKGEVKLCPEIDYPKFSIIELGLDKAWHRLNKIVYAIERDNCSECHSCQLNDYCSWCPARSWLAFGNFTQCVPANRAQAIKRFKSVK
jgi:radical SAM protein with 4Fe4S-binding SPASM domain